MKKLLGKKVIVFTAIWGVFWFITQFILYKLAAASKPIIDPVGAFYWKYGALCYPIALALYIYLEKFLHRKFSNKTSLIFSLFFTVFLLSPVWAFLGMWLSVLILAL